MKLRIAKKVNHLNAMASIEGRPGYRKSTLGRALKRMRKRFALERRHACECGRQRYTPSDKKRPCTYENCRTHRVERVPGAFGSKR